VPDASPQIFVAYTGGTIGMKETDDGYEPASGFLQRQMAELPPFQADDVPAYTVYEFDPLLDSSNLTPEDWLHVAEVIRDHYADYDGFLVVHGTDTMSFTASALSFMLHPLDKPVILTGAQLPLAETRTDAQNNLLTSLLLLGAYPSRLAGVHLFFNDRLYRGNRTTKSMPTPSRSSTPRTFRRCRGWSSSASGRATPRPTTRPSWGRCGAAPVALDTLVCGGMEVWRCGRFLHRFHARTSHSGERRTTS
jgi:L-asparaginase/Glu-tRNA(Gln) amidotransferase subunit D